MSDLVRKMQSAREEWVEISDKHELLLRRPTGLWMSTWRRKGSDEVELLRQLIVGWRNVTEADLVPSGASDAALFDVEAAIEWLSDRPSDIDTLIGKLNKMIDVRNAAKEETAKKLKAALSWRQQVQNTPQLAAGQQPDDIGSVAIDVWNLMGGKIEWSALPLMCELFGVDDPEMLIMSLAIIRDRDQT